MPAIGAPGIQELLIILAIVLVIFGPTKLKGLGRSLGTSLREFRDAMTTSKDEPPPPASDSKSQPDA